MDTRHGNNYMNQSEVPLKRVSIEPEEPMKRLERDEIGIKSGLKGSEIKKYVDNAVYKLIVVNCNKVTLKAIGTLDILYNLKETRVQKYYQLQIFSEEKLKI
jgi:hypothetical protein